MRYLKVKVPGYNGEDLYFTTIAAVWERFPPTEPMYRDVCSKARAWLVPGIAQELGSKEEHCLAVVANLE